MGFFSKNGAPQLGGAGLVPLTKDRIKAGLERAGWSYNVDSDGDIGGGWEYASFYFFATGDDNELMCVRGSWRGQLPGDQFGRALEICNDWNADKLWPKTYARVDDEGAVRLHTEHNVDFEQGLTDEQLSQQLLCAVNTSMAFYESVNEAFPEVWAQYNPEA